MNKRRWGLIQQVSFPYSRLFCDVERLENDPLEEQGLGICYDLKKILGDVYGDIWSMSKQEALDLYNNHQEALTCAVAGPTWGITIRTSLLLDCHSFSERDNVLCPNAHEFKEIDICLGFNEDETRPSDEFIDSVKTFFTLCGYRVAYNFPFSNAKTIRPIGTQPLYHSLMIEINKHCYMNEDTMLLRQATSNCIPNCKNSISYSYIFNHVR